MLISPLLVSFCNKFCNKNGSHKGGLLQKHRKKQGFFAIYDFFHGCDTGSNPVRVINSTCLK